MAVVFLAIHVLTSILDTYVHIGWFAVFVPVHFALQSILGGSGNRCARSHAGGLHLESAESTPATRHVARYPLACLRVVAHRPGPHLWPRNRLERALGHPSRRRLSAVRRPLPWVARVHRRQANDGGDAGSRLGATHPTRHDDERRKESSCVLVAALPPRCRGTIIFWVIRATSKATSTCTVPSMSRAATATPGNTTS